MHLILKYKCSFSNVSRFEILGVGDSLHNGNLVILHEDGHCSGSSPSISALAARLLPVLGYKEQVLPLPHLQGMSSQLRIEPDVLAGGRVRWVLSTFTSRRWLLSTP